MLRFVFLFFIVMGCSQDEKNSNEEEKSLVDPAIDEEESSNVGTLSIGTANFSAVLKAANTELSSENKELDLELGYVESLPQGTLSVGTNESGSLNLLETDTPLKTFTWYLSRVEISTDGTQWVNVYEGDPVPFELIQGTLSKDGISNNKIPVGEYNFLYMEIGEITWQRSHEECTELHSMGKMDLGGVLVSPDKVGQFFGGENIFDIIANADDFKQAFEEIENIREKSPSDFLEESGLKPSTNIETDEMFWYLYSPIKVEKSEDSPIVMSIAPNPDFTKGGLCDEGPGKPTFLIGTESNIAKAVASQGQKK